MKTRPRRSRVALAATVLAFGVALLAPTAPATAAPRQTIDVSRGDPCFVQAAYLNLLGRFPTLAERNRWVTQLETGTDRGSIAIELAHTREWARQVVTDLYLDILDRAPDRDGLEFWAGRLVGGARTAQLGADLYGSKEYFTRSGGTNGSYVDAVYENLLGRAPDDAGRAYWVDRLDGGSDREVVAAQFFLSLESNGKRVDTLYRHLLGRDSDAAGRSYWAVRLVNDDDLVLAGLLVGSQEFYDGHAQCVIDPDVPTGFEPDSPAADVTAGFIQNLINGARRAEEADPLTSTSAIQGRTQAWAQRNARQATLDEPAVTDILGPNADECTTIDSIVTMVSSPTFARTVILTESNRELFNDPVWDHMAVGVAHVGAYAHVVVVLVDDTPCADEE